MPLSVRGKIGFYGVTPVVRPSGADQATVTLGNVDGKIGGLTISDPPTQANVQVLRNKCEESVDDVRGLSALVPAVRGALRVGCEKPLIPRPDVSPRQCVRRLSNRAAERYGIENLSPA